MYINIYIQLYKYYLLVIMRISVFWEWSCAVWYGIADFWKNLPCPFTWQRVILSIPKIGAVEYSAKIGSLLPEYAASHFWRQSTS